MNTAVTFASLCQDKEVAEGTFKRWARSYPFLVK